MAIGRPPTPPIKRFIDKIEIGDGCWEWQAHRDKDGYGTFGTGGTPKSIRAHRWMFMYWNKAREIPADMMVCHRCDNPPCVRPDHLFLGTNQDNVDDRQRKGRGHHPRLGFQNLAVTGAKQK